MTVYSRSLLITLALFTTLTAEAAKPSLGARLKVRLGIGQRAALNEARQTWITYTQLRDSTTTQTEWDGRLKEYVEYLRTDPKSQSQMDPNLDLAQWIYAQAQELGIPPLVEPWSPEKIDRLKTLHTEEEYLREGRRLLQLDTNIAVRTQRKSVRGYNLAWERNALREADLAYESWQVGSDKEVQSIRDEAQARDLLATSRYADWIEANASRIAPDLKVLPEAERARQLHAAWNNADAARKESLPYLQ